MPSMFQVCASVLSTMQSPPSVTSSRVSSAERAFRLVGVKQLMASKIMMPRMSHVSCTEALVILCTPFISVPHTRTAWPRDVELSPTVTSIRLLGSASILLKHTHTHLSSPLVTPSCRGLDQPGLCSRGNVTLGNSKGFQGWKTPKSSRTCGNQKTWP